MNWNAKIIISTILVVAPLYAAMPIRTGDGTAGGVWYDFALRGEFITDDRVASEVWSHQVKFGFAPWEYLEFDLGLGAASFEIPRYTDGVFNGDFQPTTSATVMVQSPAMINNSFRLRTNFAYQYWRSEGKLTSYEAHVIDPSASIVIQSSYVEFEGGMLAHWSKGLMSESDFSNNYMGRAFGTLTIHNKRGFFIRGYGDASPQIEGWNHGPREMSIGALVGWRMISPKPKKGGELDRYFPAVPDMRKQQGEMKKEMDR